MKIELKKISISESLSEETTAFTADVYVDGKKIAYAKNRGQGGSTDYSVYSPHLRDKLKEAEDFCLAMPPQQYGTFEHKMDLESYIDDLIYQELKRKDTKKFENGIVKKMVNTIMWGVPNSTSYTEVKFKIPLSQIPLVQLQGFINKYKLQFKQGDVFLNTNLTALGVRL